MKHTTSSRILRSALTLVLLVAPATPVFAQWASERIENKQQIWALADVNRDGNIDPAERDRLRELFVLRADLDLIDLNGNRKLEKEEIDAFELEWKAADKKKRDELKEKEKEKEKDEKKKKKKRDKKK